MPANVEWPGFDALQASLSHITDFDARPLMERWLDIIAEGNRRGVLMGVDGHDQPMPPLKYRNGKGKSTRHRKVGAAGTSLHDETGRGPYATGWNDNLASSQYRALTGPRLAPRREASRAIKNLRTRIDHDAATNEWSVIGAWRQVVSAKGVEFLPFHFRGDGRLPKYDLRPVREKDRQLALNALRAFVTQLFRSRY